MRRGTKSLLFGAHCFFIHPVFVCVAWRRLYGFPWDPRLWLAFLIHDWGYWGKARMDDAEGERHVEWAALVMAKLFDAWPLTQVHISKGRVFQDSHPWGYLCLYHSRFYAKRDGKAFSRLCVADKLAIALTPAWLYLPMARLSGELAEYMDLAKARTAMGEPKYESMKLTTSDAERWYADVQEYLVRWVAEHRDLRPDTWTPTVAP